jgi:hypothetical protein
MTNKKTHCKQQQQQQQQQQQERQLRLSHVAQVGREKEKKRWNIDIID